MSTEQNQPEQRKRDWLLTIPADGDKGVSRDEVESKLASYSAYIGQLEKGKSGYLHWQMYISHDQPIRFSTLKNKLPTAHLEPRRGTVREAVAYVTKEKTRVQGTLPLAKGEINFKESQGQRSDLEELREEIMSSNCKLSSLLASNESAWRFERQCRALIEARNAQKWGREMRYIQVKCFFGATGTGKTRSALESADWDDIYRVTHYNNGAFDGYDAHSTLVLDEYRGQLPVSQLLTMSDPYPHKLPARYADRQAAYTNLYLLSNDAPWDWYPSAKEETKRALCRRFTEVREFTSLGESRVLEKEEVLERMLGSKLAS